MATPNIQLSNASRKSLVKHRLVRQAAKVVRAANVCFPNDSERFGDVSGEAIEKRQRELGLCGGPLADVIHETVMALASA